MSVIAQRPFYAMDNGLTKIKSCEEKAKVLKELGYAGIGWRPRKNTAEMMAALEKHGLKIFSSYVTLRMDGEKNRDPARYAKEIELLKPHGSIIWLMLAGKKQDSTDEAAIEVIRQIADYASKAGLKVALYPHAGCYIATAADSLRITKRVDRPNVGAGFNLCHFLMQNDSKDLEETVRSLKGRLLLVSTNGGDNGNRLPLAKALQRLDKGSFNNERLLKVLDEIGYKGPIALQCYRVEGDDGENLKASMNAWKELNKEEQR